MNYEKAKEAMDNGDVCVNQSLGLFYKKINEELFFRSFGFIEKDWVFSDLDENILNKYNWRLASEMEITEYKLK